MKTTKYITHNIEFTDEEIKERLLPNVTGRITTITPNINGGWEVTLIEEQKDTNNKDLPLLFSD